MKKQWTRLLIAGLSSSSVFAATYFWYESSQNKIIHRGNEKPLAYVGQVANDIQRRPAAQLLWQMVNTGEALYDGEAIRTSENSEVRIQFAGSERYLDLEPESLIVIKKSQGEIALDLMEGSLFVNSTASSEKEKVPNLVLNSANGKVDLSNAAASLSVGKGSNIDVQVLEGKASIKNERGQNQELKSKSEIRILAPALQKPIAINTENQELVSFQWQGFPAATKVSLWAGPHRKDLKEISRAPEGQNSLAVPLNLGRYYWKLVGTSATGEVVSESAIFKSEVIGRYPPTMVFPSADETLTTKNGSYDLTFAWQNGEDTAGTQLEISKDPLLTQKIATKTFTHEESFTASKLTAGTYYWRMSGYYKDSKKPFVGKIQKFTIQSPNTPPLAKIEPPAPAPVLPLEVHFNIEEEDRTQFYVNKPQVGITWEAKHAENVAVWRVKVLEENADPASVEAQEVKETKISHPVTKPGRYVASIEAVDKDGKILSTVKSEALTVKPLPLLAAPNIIAESDILQASSDGKTDLRWNQIDGAKEYIVRFKKDGAEVSKNKFTTNFTSFKNLLPGEYEVEIQAIDTYGRPGIPTTPRKMVVPDISDVKAPTLKKIKVN